ncbi:MAG: hypothetical protein ACR2OZ_09825 [Verrucomicrobiales bacterium]
MSHSLAQTVNVGSRPLPAWNIWHNPIFRRYCRSRLRPRALSVSLICTVVLAAFLFFLFRTLAMFRGDLPVADAERAPIIPLLVLQGVILFFLGTGQVAAGMTGEADEGVLDYQRLTPMSPLAKVVGYLFGLPIREYVSFAATLPFTAWALWRGQVPLAAWSHVYLVLLSAAWLYHLTGLLAGTVVKNRRWAFLIAIGVVFLLYTVIPQVAKFGLVFFKYLTIWPVFFENYADLLPRVAGGMLRLSQALLPPVQFFNLKFSETVFTLFSQGVLIVTFVVMLRRRWRRAEAHLLGKVWSAGLFVWIQVMLLGNALPQIAPGYLFPSREFGRRFLRVRNWKPEAAEAVAMIGLYGLVTMALMGALILIITPNQDTQLRGLRRARKHGLRRAAWFADEAGAFCIVVVMAVIGAIGWQFFASGLVESKWFAAQLPAYAGAAFALVLLGAGLGFHILIEAWGGKWPFLAVVFLGVVPIMAGAILGTADNRLLTSATWLAGLSPAAAPFYAAQILFPIPEVPIEMSRAIPRAFLFWQGIAAVAVTWLGWELWKTKKRRASELGTPAPESADSAVSSHQSGLLKRPDSGE